MKGISDAFAYFIDTSGQVLNELKDLLAEAKLANRETSVKLALQAIFHRLGSAPSAFGEPTNFLTHLQLSIRVGIVSPVVVHFGVLEAERLVIVRKIQILSP